MIRRAIAVVAAVAALGAPAAAQDRWARLYEERVARFEAENEQLGGRDRNVVLLGDSLTQGWECCGRVRTYLPGVRHRLLNRGIGSDGTGAFRRGILRRMEASVYDTRPSHVFLLIGVNDIGRDGRGIARTAPAYSEIVRRIRERLPRTHLTLITLSPVTGRYADMGPAIVRFNEHVRSVAREQGLELIDLHALLADERGELPPIMAGDGLHFDNPGYRILGAEIERIVAATDELPAAPPAERPSDPEVDEDDGDVGAAPTPAVEVTASLLNVRTRKWGRILGQVRRGQRLEVLEERDGWQRIRFRGREAWVSGAHTRPAAPPPSRGIVGGLR